MAFKLLLIQIAAISLKYCGVGCVNIELLMREEPMTVDQADVMGNLQRLKGIRDEVLPTPTVEPG